MRIIIVLFFIVTAFTKTFAQFDKHGNPIFNSEFISEESFDNFELTSNYYTIKDNISNKKSSVYVNDKPSLSDYLKFSRTLPSYFFIIHKEGNIIAMVILLPKTDGDKITNNYLIMDMQTGKKVEVPCNVSGEISEKRVQELEKLKADTAALIMGNASDGLYVFNKIAYRIQPYDKLKEEILTIAKVLTGSEEKIKDPEAYIKKESIDGKMDFAKMLAKEDQKIFLYDGIGYSKNDFAVYLWGKAVKEVGIETSEKAVKLWEKIYDKTLTAAEKKALLRGFTGKE